MDQRLNNRFAAVMLGCVEQEPAEIRYLDVDSRSLAPPPGLVAGEESDEEDPTSSAMAVSSSIVKDEQQVGPVLCDGKK